MFKLSFDVSGVESVDRLLGDVLGATENLKPALEEIVDEFFDGNRIVFQREGAVGGGFSKWAPLNPEYAEEKVRLGYPSKILQRTEDLKNSLTRRSDANAHSRITNSTAEMGTLVPYATYHKSGTKTMPKREPIRITGNRKKRWVRIVKKHILSAGNRQNL